MSSTSHADLEDIKTFCKRANVKFLSSQCIIKKSEIGGLGVFAEENIKEGTVLLRVPKSSVFSASNSSIANLLLENEIDGMLALNLAFIYETTIFRSKSHWYHYLKSIQIENDKDELYLPPSYWPDSSKSPLSGTALDTLFDALRPEDEIRESYDMANELAHKWKNEFGLQIPNLVFPNDEEVFDEEKFLRFVATAYAISSRVFEIDNYHESGLVVIADLFNHHVDSPDVRFESIFDVCESCGEIGPCGHVIPDDDPDVNERLDDELKTPSQSTEISQALIEELERETALELENSSGEKKDDLVPDECVDITLMKPVNAGSEIFNSYGDLSNALLLARYGFCIASNVHDVVHLAPDLLRFWKKNKRKFDERFRFWADMGYELFTDWFDAKRAEETESDEEEGYNSRESASELSETLSDSEEANNSGGENSWHSNMFLISNGDTTPSLRALINLLTLNTVEWKKLTKSAAQEEKINRFLPILERKFNNEAKKLMITLLAPKQALYVSNLTKVSNPDVRTLLESEATIIENCLKALE